MRILMEYIALLISLGIVLALGLGAMYLLWNDLKDKED